MIRWSEKRNSHSSGFRFLFYALVVFISLMGLFSVVASFLSPAKIWVFAIFGLVFQYIYPVNFILLLVCLWRRTRFFVFPFIPFIIGIPTVPAIFQTGVISSLKTKNDLASIKVMSYNVRLFDLYNWTNNKQTRTGIFELLQKENPDILCIQEFYTSDKNPDRNLEAIIKTLRTKYYHVEYPVTLRGTDHWGIATFSAFPVVGKGAHYFGEKGGNLCLYTDILVNADTLRVFNTHLESIRFKKEDYRFIQNIENSDEKETLKGTRTILKRLQKAYRKRVNETLMTDSLFKASPYKHILCGDFNDTPSSYTYSVLTRNMNDAFRESGRGFSETYRGPFPAYRIDYILHDKTIRSFNYRKVNAELSDHYPVTCEISLN